MNISDFEGPGSSELAAARATPISDAIRKRLDERLSTRRKLTASFGRTKRPDDQPVRDSRAIPLLRQEPKNLPPTHDTEDPLLLSCAAAEIYRMRRARDAEFPADLAGEPAWDILLALYAEEPAELPVSTLVHGSGLNQRAGLRWIDGLERRGLIERRQHALGDHLTFISLTSEGRALIERSLKAMLRAARD